MNELSISDKNKLITEWMGECWHDKDVVEFSVDNFGGKFYKCGDCGFTPVTEFLVRSLRRNFYEGDRSYKDIADAWLFLMEQDTEAIDHVADNLSEIMSGIPNFHDIHMATAVASTPAQKADALVAMITLETKP